MATTCRSSAKENRKVGRAITALKQLFFLLCITGALVQGALVSKDKAVKAAAVAGYSDIRVTDTAIVTVSLRGCDRFDTVRFTVRGVSPAGSEQDFFVCASLFKGGTIRSK